MDCVHEELKRGETLLSVDDSPFLKVSRRVANLLMDQGT